MALDIVTSYQGTDHITADQMADFQRGLVGSDCIMPVGNKMEVNIQTANQITVSDGVVIYDGREIHIPYGTSENVAITSGTQGMLRNDIVCIQYNRDESSGIESVEFVTIAGTPAASDPQDPAYSNLDIRTGVFMSQKPFCRVRLNGTAIEGIDMLVETYEMGLYQLNNDLNQSVLWSGQIFLNSSQSITLTEKISDQKTGILVIFSRYDNGYRNIVCIDYSETVIATMKSRRGKRETLEYQVMDATKMTFTATTGEGSCLDNSEDIQLTFFILPTITQMRVRYATAYSDLVSTDITKRAYESYIAVPSESDGNQATGVIDPGAAGKKFYFRRNQQYVINGTGGQIAATDDK